jgi:hypothetical protein
MPTVDTMEEAAVSFGLHPIEERVLRIPMEDYSFWLLGMSWAVTSTDGRTRMRLKAGELPAWAPLAWMGAALLPMAFRASFHPLNDLAKFLSLSFLVAFGPYGLVFFIAGRFRRKLLRRARALEHQVG